MADEELITEPGEMPREIVYAHRVCIVVPDALRSDAQAVSAAMGWGQGSYTLPLSPTGEEPATHWGLSAQVASGFLAMIQAVEAGHAVPGIDAAVVGPVVAAISFEVGPAEANPIEQLDQLIERLGLKRVEVVAEDLGGTA